MSEAELLALVALVNCETTAMHWANKYREMQGYSIMYDDAAFTQLDCVRCLDAELRQRKVLVTA